MRWQLNAWKCRYRRFLYAYPVFTIYSIFYRLLKIQNKKTLNVGAETRGDDDIEKNPQKMIPDG